MGKVRNLRRNPAVTVDDLLSAGWGGTVTHLGQEMAVSRNGLGNRSWILRSEQGVRYSAVPRRDGSVAVELLGL